jgi:Ca2+-binding RTX toxin-like protein
MEAAHLTRGATPTQQEEAMGYYEGGVLDDELEGSADDDVFEGLGGDDTLYGLAGDDLMDGGTGDDAMYGGVDNDTYYVHSENDRVYEYAGGGTDLIWTLVEYTLPAHVEHLNLFESAGAITAFGNNLDNGINGNSSANTLYGWGGNDTINGGLGNDTMLGGTGDDAYFADNANDVVVEALDSGIDTVYAGASYSIAAQANVENLTLMPAALNGAATGNDLANIIIGNGTANVLVGNGGNDSSMAASATTSWAAVKEMTSTTGAMPATRSWNLPTRAPTPFVRR